MLDPVTNFAKVTVSSGYTAGDTSVNLLSGAGSKLPDPADDGPFNLVWFNSSDYGDPADDPGVEIVRCTARSADTLILTRAQEGTSASAKNATGKTYQMVLAVTAKMISDIAAQGTGEPVENEVVTGSGTAWTLAATPIAGSVKLYAGTRLTPGVSADYTISGVNITTAASYPAGALVVDYRT